MKGVFLIGFAVFIDALQVAFGLAFAALEAVTPVGGGVGAAGVCAAFSTGIVNKLINGLTCFVFGAGTSAFAIPIGGAVDVVISFTLGGALIAALVFTGYFSIGAVTGGSLVELIPFFDIIPGWTFMAWKCVHNKKQQERAAKAARVQQTEAVEPSAPRAFDGIRAANDNYPERALYEVAA
jgi:hypothetical protein